MKLPSKPALGLNKLLGWGALAVAATVPALAQEATSTAPAIDPGSLSSLRMGLDTLWVLVAAMLVFWMNAGFALVESGLCRAKNCTNILAKNFIVFAISSLSF